MTNESSEIAKIMSSSVAPVFLITSIAAILATMSLRYGRVIDRIRTLLREGPRLYQKEIAADHLAHEMRSLYRRARLLRIAIILEVASVCLVTLTIFLIFFAMSFSIELPYLPQLFFSASLILLIVGLVLFIQDFALSLRCIERDMNVRSHVTIAHEELHK